MANNTAPTPPVTENTEETTSLDTVLLVLRRYWFIIILQPSPEVRRLTT